MAHGKVSLRTGQDHISFYPLDTSHLSLPRGAQWHNEPQPGLWNREPWVLPMLLPSLSFHSSSAELGQQPSHPGQALASVSPHTHVNTPHIPRFTLVIYQAFKKRRQKDKINMLMITMMIMCFPCFSSEGHREWCGHLSEVF